MESSVHGEDVAKARENLTETFGADSEPVLAAGSRQRELEHQLEEAEKLAGLLEADVDDRERCCSQLDRDVRSLMDWLTGIVEELNQLSVSPPSESDDDLLRRHSTVKVMMHWF